MEPRYANGSGPINTDAKAAIRTLSVGGDDIGVLVMPQRGTDRWTDWGYGTGLRLELPAAEYTLRLLLLSPQDENMDGRVNTALLDHLRLTRLSVGRVRPGRVPLSAAEEMASRRVTRVSRVRSR